MHKLGPILLLLVFCSVAFAQLDSNSITVSASNNTTLQPDQILFSITVTSGLNAGLDDVLAALQPAGITMANLSGVTTQGIVSSLTAPTPSLFWSFTLPAPIASSKTTVTSLTMLQQTIAGANNGLAMSFSVIGTQVSQQLAQSQTCSFPSLITSATTQAQALATAGGLTLGSILALSSSTSNVVLNSSYSSIGPYVSVISNSSPPPCAITVKFSVAGN